MALTEFDIIRRYFADFPLPAHTQGSIVLGVGDDAAIVKIPESCELVFSIDTQLAGVHFPADADPALIAQRAFHCAISDLAAMGAEPLCFTLALTLPEANESWLSAFSQGLKEAAAFFRCPLVGGDTTKGSLCITLQVHGTLSLGTALKRSGAKVGDVILVSGSLGSSAAYVELMKQNRLEEISLAHARELFSQDYFSPQIPLTLGKALRPYARSALDISDGLLADLTHICRASKLNAELQLDKLPMLPELITTFGREKATELALCGGDDYQLCFTAAENKVRKIISLSEDMECPVTVIGRMLDTPFHSTQPVTCYTSDGKIFDITTLRSTGYTHF